MTQAWLTDSNTHLNKPSKSKWYERKADTKYHKAYLDVAGQSIVIHRQSSCSSTIWFLTYGTKVQSEMLESKDLNEAKRQAVEIVSVILHEALTELGDELKLS